MPEIERFINADVLWGDGYDPLTLNGYAFAGYAATGVKIGIG